MCEMLEPHRAVRDGQTAIFDSTFPLLPHLPDSGTEEHKHIVEKLPHRLIAQISILPAFTIRPETQLRSQARKPAPLTT